MKLFLLIAVFTLISNCWSRAVTEESVVSVYDPAVGTQNVYSQIANNIAEKITSPFYKFLGIPNTTTTTKRPFEHIELQDIEKNITNEIADRDVEELSLEAFKKTDKKPEKVTLFSSYLPTLTNNKLKTIDSQKTNDKQETIGKLETKSYLEKFNETRNEVDDDDFDDEFSLDEVDPADKPRGPLVYILELAGSILQLLWGGFLALFRPTSSS